MIPNRYTYADIQLGQTESFSVNITEEMMQQFYSITADKNPLHLDDAYAQRMGFEGRAVYGLLTASFLSTLAGVYLPGEYSLIHSVDVEFPRAVRIGQRLEITGRVIAKDDRFRTFIMRVSITNEAGQKVCRGKMQMGVLV